MEAVMKTIKLYTGERVYMFPNGSLADKTAVLAQFPAALSFKHIVESDESDEVMFALQNLSAVRSFYDIDPALNDEDAIAAIQEAVNAPPPKSEPSAEERIAAAMEFQNAMSL